MGKGECCLTSGSPLRWSRSFILISAYNQKGAASEFKEWGLYQFPKGNYGICIFLLLQSLLYMVRAQQSLDEWKVWKDRAFITKMNKH